ncbi:hypothetical protein ACWGR4_15590 [Embleya sp. NPDC055664]
MAPSSTRTWSTPWARSTSTFAARRVVASTVAPIPLAGAAAARPTEEVPPRISRLCPARRSSPVVDEPYAVCNVSGTAPITCQGRSDTNPITWSTGTSVYCA